MVAAVQVQRTPQASQKALKLSQRQTPKTQPEPATEQATQDSEDEDTVRNVLLELPLESTSCRLSSALASTCCRIMALCAHLMHFEKETLSLQNVADIKKLQAAGICTIRGVMMTTKKRMCEIKGLSEAKVDKIKEVASKLCVSEFLSCVSGDRPCAESWLRDGTGGITPPQAVLPHLNWQYRT